MAHLETLTLEHLPAGYQIHLALFRDVKNAEFLQKQLLEGNTDFEYAFLDASIIISKIHLLAAVFRAVNERLNNRLKTKNVHSETVFCLSPNNNISESFRRFGIQPSSTSVIAVKISSSSSPSDLTGESVERHLREKVEGELVDVSRIGEEGLVDWARVRKVYKVVLPARKGDPALTEGEKREVEVQVLATMALRGAT